MATIELPHTPGCLVCGRANPHGLYLSLAVDPDTGAVSTNYTPLPAHIGFEGVVHGGVLATVADEAMVWAAIWATRRACLAGEFTIRFRRKAEIGAPLAVEAHVTRNRSRMVEADFEMRDAATQKLVAVGSGKYVSLSLEDTTAFAKTFVREPATEATIHLFESEPPGP